jgi:predicted amidohydrolase YtcJ
VQPRQLHHTGDWIRHTGLPPRLAYQAFAQMREAGALLAGSSDAPVFDFDVLGAIDTAVRRRLASGAAAVLGMEGEIGQLRPGARADAIVLSEALETVAADRIAELGVVATFAGRTALEL